MGAGKLLRLAAFVGTTFAAGLGARMALAEVLPSPTLPTPTVSVTVPPVPTVTTPSLPTPTVTTPPLPTTSTPTQPAPPKPAPAPPTTTSGGTTSTPSHPGAAPGSPPTGAGPTGSASNSAAPSAASSKRSARLHALRASIARRGGNGHGTALGGDAAGSSDDANHVGTADQANGSVPGATRKEASTFTPAAVAGRVSNPLVIAALAAAVLLLGTAALPRGLVPSPRLTLALIEHRTAIAAAGAAALCSAIVVA